jgi:ketosteroid isomerase-like protein
MPRSIDMRRYHLARHALTAIAASLSLAAATMAMSTSLDAQVALARATSSATRVDSTQDDADLIRRRRESSNAAIARHDTAGIAAILAPQVVVVTSNSAQVIGRAANARLFAEQFRTRPDVRYRRTPEAVTVFAPWGMASESGRWTGGWTDDDGRITLGGRYFAKWRVIEGEWLVESETYVPEQCTGGRYCSTRP